MPPATRSRSRPTAGTIPASASAPCRSAKRCWPASWPTTSSATAPSAGRCRDRSPHPNPPRLRRREGPAPKGAAGWGLSPVPLPQRRERGRDDQRILLDQGLAGLPAARRPDAFLAGLFAHREAVGRVLVGPDVAPAV